jgi:hypothetical protein
MGLCWDFRNDDRWSIRAQSSKIISRAANRSNKNRIRKRKLKVNLPKEYSRLIRVMVVMLLIFSTYMFLHVLKEQRTNVSGIGSQNVYVPIKVEADLKVNEIYGIGYVNSQPVLVDIGYISVENNETVYHVWPSAKPIDLNQ